MIRSLNAIKFNFKITVLDYYSSPSSNGFTEPNLDTDFKGGYNNIISYSGSQNSSSTTMRFSKQMVTNDTVADNYLVGGNVLYVFHFITLRNNCNFQSFFGYN